MRTQRKATDLVFICSWFLKVGVSAALAVLLPVSVSLSVSVLVFWRLRGRARGQDVIADIIKDTEEDREIVSAVACAATFHRCVATLPAHLRSASGALFSSSLPGNTMAHHEHQESLLIARSRGANVTFVLLLELLVSSSLPEVRQDLSQLRDHNVVGCQSRLSLKDRIQQTATVSNHPESCQLQFGTSSNPLRQYLHTGAVGFTADQSRGDVGVSELIIQVDYVGHPAREEELVPLDLAGAEQHAVDVPTCGVTQRIEESYDTPRKEDLQDLTGASHCYIEVKLRSRCCDSPSRVLNSIFSSGSTSFLKHTSSASLIGPTLFNCTHHPQSSQTLWSISSLLVNNCPDVTSEHGRLMLEGVTFLTLLLSELFPSCLLLLFLYLWFQLSPGRHEPKQVGHITNRGFKTSLNLTCIANLKTIEHLIKQ